MLKFTNAKDEADYRRYLWRLENDRPSRDQFHEIPFDDDNYICDLPHPPLAPDHVRPADYVRPPMPEVFATHERHLCAACWSELPATQADAMALPSPLE